MNINNSCPKCKKSGSLLSSVVAKETSTIDSSCFGGGVGLTSSGIIPVLGGMSGSSVVKTKRAELLEEPEKPPLNANVVIILVSLIGMPLAFNIFPDIFRGAFDSPLFSMFHGVSQWSPAVFIVFFLFMIVKILFGHNEILEEEEEKQREYRQKMAKYENTFLCEDCDILFNPATGETAFCSERGLNQLLDVSR